MRLFRCRNCYSLDQIVDQNGDYCYVFCTNCPTSIEGANREKAIAKWNRHCGIREATAVDRLLRYDAVCKVIA